MAGEKSKRRAKGEGAEWYDEKTGRWHRRLIYHGQRIDVADTDRSLAKEKLDDRKKLIGLQLDRHSSQQTLAAFLEWWLNDQQNRVKAKTLQDYQFRIEYHILRDVGPIRKFGQTRLIDLRPGAIHDWSQAVYKAYAHNSAKQALSLLRRALGVAVALKYLSENPAAPIKIPRNPRKSETSTNVLETHGTALTEAQVQALIAASQERRTPAHKIDARSWVDAEALFLVGARLGLRLGEVLGLRIVDLDLDRGFLHVRQQLEVIEGRLHIETPKSKAGVRAIPLDSELQSALRLHLQRRRERQLKAGTRWSGSDHLFATPLGKPIRPDNLRKHFRECLLAAELPRIRFHDLRVTAISRMRDAGVDAEVIAAIVGHSNVNITLDIYTRVGHVRMRDALERAHKSA